ncbi:MAG: BamA/TamA family outer membrane protein [Candidatus Eiseniibacteriota bacterium]|jgi:outer membrane protein insertion porin family
MALGVALAMLAAVRPAVAADLPEVERIEVRGARAVSADQLRDLMRTRAPSFWRPFRSTPYRADILDRDLERIESYYANQGFLGARATRTVERTSDGDRVRIVITVDEGRPTRIGSVVVRGRLELPEETVTDVIASETGDRYSPDRVALDRQRILELYADQGRPFTAVTDSVHVSDDVADIVFDIQAAPRTRVSEILIEGTRSTKQYVIKRELTLDRGDPLARSRVLESRERLLETGFFRDVRFEPVTDGSDLAPRFVPLRVVVNERKMGWVEAGVGYNSSQQLRLGGEVGHRNVLGNAHRVVANGRVDFDVDALLKGDRQVIEESRVGLSFREPWLLSTRTVGTIGVFSEFTREPERTTEGIQDEVVQGVALSADRGLGSPLHLRTTLENRWITQRRVRETVTGEGTTTELEDQEFVTRSLAFLVERDRRDNPFDPARGSLQSWLAEVAGGALGGTSSYLKFSLSTSWYRPLGGRLVVASRLRGGWIHPFGPREPGERPIDRVPREARFRAGGATTVRGYPEDSLGPQSVSPGQAEPLTDRGLATLVANLELRFPLFWRLGGAVFLDGGNVWEEAGDIDLGDLWPDDDGASLEDVRYSVGGGVRLGTPLGPLRLDYGYGLVRGEPERLIDATSGGEWHFSLGQAF